MADDAEAANLGDGRDGRFIPGIYHYCDRWCERCAFTLRCSNHAIGERVFAAPESRDPGNEQFWRNLARLFRATARKVREAAARSGVDLAAAAAAGRDSERVWDDARGHECARGARRYAESVDAWFRAAEASFVEHERELAARERLGLPLGAARAEHGRVEEAVQVLRWYQHQIPAKLVRAVAGLVDPYASPPGDLPSDSDGSAKVALVAMDRSIEAWRQLRALVPEQADSILDLLLQLDRLRRRTEAVFPLARVFVRPGFDEPAEVRDATA
jgi:hypothetical protein